MKTVEILRLESLSREPMVIEGYLFKGTDPDAPKVAIIGAMQGDALIPLHASASLINFLKNKIKAQKILGDVLIIPSINHYALNISEKFWPLDKTNINMMFPGFDQGETTQRIAQKVFEAIKDYDYGVVLETRTDQSICIPYLMLLKSSWEDMQGAQNFGLKIIHHKELESIDTVTLQYNWQLWGTKAYSIMCPAEQKIDEEVSKEIIQSMIRFMNENKIIKYPIFKEYNSNILQSKNIYTIKSPNSGMFISTKSLGSYITKGEVLGKIIDSLNGKVIHQFKSKVDGKLLCMFNNALVNENAIVYKIAKINR